MVAVKRHPPQRLRRVDVAAMIDFQSPDPQGVDTSTRKNTAHEKGEQKALFDWVQLQPWHHQWVHWPNERAKATGDKSGFADRERIDLSKQGVKRGMPDNWLFMPIGNHPGAVSELKRVGATRSAVSPEQRWWLTTLEAQGWAVGVHRGWVEASEFFLDYVAGNWSTDGQEWWR